MKNRTNKRKSHRGGAEQRNDVLSKQRVDVLREHYEVLGPHDGDTIEIKSEIEKAIDTFIEAKQETNTYESLELKLSAKQILKHIDDLRRSIANEELPAQSLALQRRPRNVFPQALTQPMNMSGGYYKRKTNKKRKTKRRYLRF